MIQAKIKNSIPLNQLRSMAGQMADEILLTK